jgi:hypothetical protein
MKRRLACGLAILLSSCAAAFAQNAASPEKLALAGEIFDLTSNKQQTDENFRKAKEKAAKNSNATASTGLAAMEDTLKALRPQMRATWVEAYAAYFSLKELKELKAFYQSPLGIKLHAVEPPLSQKLMSMMTTQMITLLAIQQQTPASTAPEKAP